MTSINGIPPELVRVICEYLSKKDLLSLCLVSKNLNQLAIPLLYSNISFNWGAATRKWLYREECKAYVQNYTDQPPVPLLFRTLVSSPHLSAHVNSIEYLGVKPYPNWKLFNHYDWLDQLKIPSGKSRTVWLQYNRKFSHQETRRAMKFIHNLPFTRTEQKTWISEYNQGNMDIFVCLVILASSNLKFLRVGWDFCRTNFIQTIFGNSFRLFHKSLQTADFCSDLAWPEDITLRNQQNTFDSFYNLYSLPVLTSLVVSPSSTHLQLPTSYTASKLTSLALCRTSLNEDDLDRLLQFTPHLSSFLLDFWIEIEVHNDENKMWFDCVKFSRALRHVRNSLQKLVLSVIFFDLEKNEYDTGHRLVNPPIQGLHLIPKLEILEIPWTILLGWSHEPNRVARLKDVLPPWLSLRTLILRDDIWYKCINNQRDRINNQYIFGGRWTEEALLGMIQDYLLNPASRPGFQMAISRITIRLCQWDDIWAQPWRLRLEEICGGAGVVGRVEIQEPLYEAFKTNYRKKYVAVH